MPRAQGGPKMAVGTWAWVFGPYANAPLPLREVARSVKEIGYDGVGVRDIAGC